MADLLHTPFPGLKPFSVVAGAFANVLAAPRGWALIVTGALVSGLFAAYAFAISAFSAPMPVPVRGAAPTTTGLAAGVSAPHDGGMILAAMQGASRAPQSQTEGKIHDKLASHPNDRHTGRRL